LTVYVIGAGLAGLAAAVRLAAQGRRVELIEASAQAGGRCRSYRDPVLEMTLDNGNHLVLSGNDATFDYLRYLGAEGCMAGPDEAALAFADVASGERWTLRANDGPVPWWILDERRAVPGVKPLDYLGVAGLLRARRGRTVGEAMRCEGPLWERLMEPFLLAALNTDAREASAALAASVIRQSLARGGRAYRPRIAHPTLSAAFVEPALAFLAVRGARVRYASPVKALSFDADRVSEVVFADGEEPVRQGEAVVLAVPPWIAPGLVPDLTAPDRFNAIVNGHFRFAPPPGASPIVGVIGGAAQWIFAFDDRFSVTVSAADDLADEDREALARRFWADIATVHGLPVEPLPPWRIVKERRATFAATPEQDARRPGPATRWNNLFIAGDWTQTGLPSTIEGAIRSGNRAAELVLRSAKAARP
jgi:squalene-associated FAD-dependent desaturase